ncbi:hypothetical protein ABZW49_46025 [Nonomuraea wenchangensis]
MRELMTHTAGFTYGSDDRHGVPHPARQTPPLGRAVLHGRSAATAAGAEPPVGRGTYQGDGAAGTWFWVDPQHDLLYIGMIQLLSSSAPPLQKITQALLADAILDPGTTP